MNLGVVGYQAPAPVRPVLGGVRVDERPGVVETAWGTSKASRRAMREELRREAERARVPGRVWSWDRRAAR